MSTRRHKARTVVMQTLFESSSRGTKDLSPVLTRNIHGTGPECVDTAFASQLLHGIVLRHDDILSAFLTYAPDWPIERIDPITRCILTVGAYELLYESAIPSAVIMNEAIEMAKEFGTPESGRFVNGVLNALAKKCRT